MLLGTTGCGWEQAVICIIMVLLLCIIIIRQHTYTILYSPTIRMVIQLESQYEDVLLRKMKLINTMEVDWEADLVENFKDPPQLPSSSHRWWRYPVVSLTVPRPIITLMLIFINNYRGASGSNCSAPSPSTDNLILITLHLTHHHNQQMVWIKYFPIWNIFDCVSGADEWPDDMDGGDANISPHLGG